MGAVGKVSDDEKDPDLLLIVIAHFGLPRPLLRNYGEVNIMTHSCTLDRLRNQRGDPCLVLIEMVRVDHHRPDVGMPTMTLYGLQPHTVSL